MVERRPHPPPFSRWVPQPPPAITPPGRKFSRRPTTPPAATNAPGGRCPASHRTPPPATNAPGQTLSRRPMTPPPATNAPGRTLSRQPPHSSPANAAPGRPLSRMMYDVFLSFRGEDVRGKFIDHLYTRLQLLKVNAFMDDKKLSRGNVIENSILQAIQGSRISVIVFSPGFAYSIWCLDELVNIVRCISDRGHVAMPVFFHVSPADVAAQAGVYASAFKRHLMVFAEERVASWRNALITVSGISGWAFGENE